MARVSANRLDFPSRRWWRVHATNQLRRGSLCFGRGGHPKSYQEREARAESAETTSVSCASTDLVSEILTRRLTKYLICRSSRLDDLLCLSGFAMTTVMTVSFLGPSLVATHRSYRRAGRSAPPNYSRSVLQVAGAPCPYVSTPSSHWSYPGPSPIPFMINLMAQSWSQQTYRARPKFCSIKSMLETPELDLRIVHHHPLLRGFAEISDQLHYLRNRVNVRVILRSGLLR